MFTGIITDIGTITAAVTTTGRRFTISTAYDATGIALGASIACNGVCLTVIEKAHGWFAADVSPETLSCTTAAAWQVGTRLNLERPLKLGDELGGHLVLGHVDGVGHVVSIVPQGDSYELTFAAPAALACFIAPKGSVTIDGTSLTVNKAEDSHFTVMIIPHTWEHTIFADYKAGVEVNLEIDMFARYIARLVGNK